MAHALSFMDEAPPTEEPTPEDRARLVCRVEGYDVIADTLRARGWAVWHSGMGPAHWNLWWKTSRFRLDCVDHMVALLIKCIIENKFILIFDSILDFLIYFWSGLFVFVRCHNIINQERILYAIQPWTRLYNCSQ